MTDETHAIPKDQLDLEQFWAVDAEGQCWLHVLCRLTLKEPNDSTGWLLWQFPDGHIRWLLNKERFTPARLSAATGVTAEKFTDAVHTITLPALEKAEKPNQPKPTVSYFGEA